MLYFPGLDEQSTPEGYTWFAKRFSGTDSEGRDVWADEYGNILYDNPHWENLPAVTVSSSYNPSNDGNENDWLQDAQTGIGAFDFANGAKTEIIEYAVRTGSSQSGVRAELQVLGKAGTRYLNAAKGLSKGAGILGVAFTGVDAYQKGQWQNHHYADVVIGLGTTLMLSGPWGWVAGGAYFLIDLGVKSYSGKSITEN